MPASSKYPASLRMKLLGRMSLLMLVIFSALWIVVAERTQKALYSALDEAVLARAESVAALLSYDAASGMLRLEKNERLMYEFRADEDDAFFQVRDASNGRICFLSPSLRGKAFQSEEIKKHAGKKSKKRVYWNDVFGGDNVRCLRWLTSPQKRDISTSATIPFGAECPVALPPSLEIIVGIEREDVDRSYQKIVAYSGGAFFLTFILVLLLTDLLLSYSLRSLIRLSKELDQIEKLSSSVSISAGGDRETRCVATAVNALLARLAQSLEWERRMTANVAHELRTPLSALRSTMEVALSRVRTEGEYREAMDDSLGLVCQMQRLVENLLNLARIESGQAQIVREEVNLAQQIRDCWKMFESRAAEKQIAIDLQVDEKATASTDREKMRVILNNLLDNAVEYTPSNGRIGIRVRQEAGDSSCEIIVENSGNPLTSEDLQNIFKRFHRQDKAREAGVHFGIGLNLVHSLCDLLDIQILATSRPEIALSLFLILKQRTENSNT